jgi:transcriptional regulator with XRE-family HTH domain
MDFAKAIRICRGAHGLSQSELARRLDVSPSQISLVESGRRQPSADLLKEISRVLEVPLPLLTLLGSEKSDISEHYGEDEIADLGKTLLKLLVRVSRTNPESV